MKKYVGFLAILLAALLVMNGFAFPVIVAEAETETEAEEASETEAAETSEDETEAETEEVSEDETDAEAAETSEDEADAETADLSEDETDPAESVIPDLTYRHTAEEGLEYASVCAGSDGELLWEYTTPSFEAAETDRIEPVGVYPGGYLIKADTSLLCLDFESGEVLWENTELQGSGLSVYITPDETICVSCYSGTPLILIDRNGQTLYNALTDPEAAYITANYYAFSGIRPSEDGGLLLTAVNAAGAYENVPVALPEGLRLPEYASERYCLPGDTFVFGSFDQDGKERNGAEPIEWTVLDNQGGCLLLITKDALANLPYRADGGEAVWEESTLRTWLNSDFYETAFSGEEKERIVSMDHADPADPDAVLFDKLFCLSEYETALYLPTEAGRAAVNSVTAEKQMMDNMLASAYYPDDRTAVRETVEGWDAVYGRQCAWWWVRDDSGNPFRSVDPAGVIIEETQTDDLGSIRPVIRIWPYEFCTADAEDEDAAGDGETDTEESDDEVSGDTDNAGDAEETDAALQPEDGKAPRDLPEKKLTGGELIEEAADVTPGNRYLSSFRDSDIAWFVLKTDETAEYSFEFSNSSPYSELWLTVYDETMTPLTEITSMLGYEKASVLALEANRTCLIAVSRSPYQRLSTSDFVFAIRKK